MKDLVFFDDQDVSENFRAGNSDELIEDSDVFVVYVEGNAYLNTAEAVRLAEYLLRATRKA